MSSRGFSPAHARVVSIRKTACSPSASKLSSSKSKLLVTITLEQNGSTKAGLYLLDYHLVERVLSGNSFTARRNCPVPRDPFKTTGTVFSPPGQSGRVLLMTSL